MGHIKPGQWERHTGLAWRRHRGLTGALLPSSPQHSDVGFWGKTMRGSTGSLLGAKNGGERLQDGSRRRLPSYEHGRRWATALALFRLQEVAQRLPHGLLLLLGQFNVSNQWRLAQIWWRLGFDGFQALRVKIWAMGCAIYRGFLDRIIDSKNLNSFLVWIELYLAKIWKKSKKGRNQFRLRYEFLVSCRVSDG
jgi:hypothetical protein